MDRIAPLAKILAEANGIDWQKLDGTGSGGMIVEQDILNYLSRVMSGEEDPPSTPVDPTPADWTGDEIPSADMLNKAGMNADMLSRAGVDTDITAFVEQARTAVSPQVPATPTGSSLEDEDLEFELEDEESAAQPVAAAPEPTMPEPTLPEPALPDPIPATPEPTVNAPAFAATEPAAPQPAATAGGWNWGTPTPGHTPDPAPAHLPEGAAADVPVVMPPPVFTPAPDVTHEAAQSDVPQIAAPQLEVPQMEAPQPAAEPAPAPVAEAAAATGLAAGLGSLLSRLYQKPAPEATPVTPESVATQPAEVAATAPEPAAPEPVESEPVEPAPVVAEPVAAEETAADAAPAWTDGRQEQDQAWAEPAATAQAPEPEALEPEVSEPEVLESATAEPVEAATDSAEITGSTGMTDTDEAFVEAPQADLPVEETAPAEPAITAEPESAPEPEIAPEPDIAAEPEVAAVADVSEPEVTEPEVAPEPELAEPEATEPELAEPEVAAPEVTEPEDARTDVPAAAQEVPQDAAEEEAPVLVAPVSAVVHTPAAAPANAVWFGAYLRRDADVAALRDLQRQVSAALEQDLPLGLLVARAAQRHADTLGLGSVAVQGDTHAQTVGTGSLRDALAQLGTAQDGTPDLLVVDAGAHGLDDLHFPHTLTLSVGRVQDGRAALTLNGDVNPAHAAHFLAQVAGTLEQPILLVL
ncbi:hypothetical protein CBQ26_18850 [Deinococcus indicus]|uniref:Peripheral subunit-binding (PSBD) domain-containing protein n=1 Tax=Deinococcus indicus TaxID=223556 RepID=A0A246BEV8_9DEIO|nr:E3 binding domain-containing protein [Deinococcus indicus]OWL93747.1 hypothetical protein CBQ26_18850 [Deinococcus indicus]GHG35047.1 hypothetical protein GCM10017784_31180 [Deinococcus indicus]